MSLVTLKIVYNASDIRRVSIPSNSTIDDVKTMIKASFAVNNPWLKYTDAEGDEIRVVTQADWEHAIEYGLQSQLLRLQGKNYFFEQEFYIHPLIYLFSY